MAKTILATAMLLGVAAMMMISIIPAMAEPIAEADSHIKGHDGPPVKRGSPACEHLPKQVPVAVRIALGCEISRK